MDKCGVTIASWVTIGIVMVLLIMFTVMINVGSGLRGAKAEPVPDAYKLIEIEPISYKSNDGPETKTSARALGCKSKQCCHNVSIRGQNPNEIIRAAGNVLIWGKSISDPKSNVRGNQKTSVGSGKQTANITACVTGANKDTLVISGKFDRFTIKPDQIEQAAASMSRV